MIVFVTLCILAFDGGSTLIFLADEALILESLLLDILDTLNADNAILFFEITLRHPDGTYIVHPNIMAYWNFGRISRFYKVVVVAFFLSLPFLSYHLHDVVVVLLVLCLLPFHLLFHNIFLLLLIVWTFLRIFIVRRIRLFKQVDIDVNRCSFHGSSFHIAKRAGQVDTCRPEG